MQIRPYAADDGERVVEFLRAASALDRTLRPVSMQGWRDFAGESTNRDGRDFAVATGDDGAIVALLTSARIDDGDRALRHFRIIVDPRHRRRGIATRLLARVEHQDAPGPVTDQANCEDGWDAGGAFLVRHGFAVAAMSFDMLRDGPPPPAAPLPGGVRLRADSGGARDADAWIALSEEGYRGTPGYSPLTPADVAQRRAQPGSHMWVAEEMSEGGAIVGHCRTVLWQGHEPWIDSVVVTPRARGRGLGRALTAAGLRTLAAAGHARVRLNVRGDNAPARRVYDSLGFGVAATVQTFRRSRAAGV